MSKNKMAKIWSKKKKNRNKLGNEKRNALILLKLMTHDLIVPIKEQKVKRIKETQNKWEKGRLNVIISILNGFDKYLLFISNVYIKMYDTKIDE